MPARLIVPDENVARKREAQEAKAEALQLVEAGKDLGPTAVQAAQTALQGQEQAQ